MLRIHQKHVLSVLSVPGKVPVYLKPLQTDHDRNTNQRNLLDYYLACNILSASPFIITADGHQLFFKPVQVNQGKIL